MGKVREASNKIGIEIKDEKKETGRDREVKGENRCKINKQERLIRLVSALITD